MGGMSRIPNLCTCRVLSYVFLFVRQNREWDAGLLAGDNEPTAVRRMCKSCLLLLSVPTVHREAATHASAVLVHLALASWRASGRWPSRDDGLPSADTAAATADASKPQRSVPPPEEKSGAGLRLAAAATVVSRSFFPAERGPSGGGREGADADDDGTAALIAGFMPLPPAPGLAVCRALLHVVPPRVLLASLGPEGGPPAEARAPPAAVVEAGGRGLGAEETGAGGCVGEAGGLAGAGLEGGGAASGENLMLGPILRVILRHGGASSGLSLRFLALQVRAGSQRCAVVALCFCCVKIRLPCLSGHGTLSFLLSRGTAVKQRCGAHGRSGMPRSPGTRISAPWGTAVREHM